VTPVIRAALALLPVLCFLVVLMTMDSFKLVRPRAVAVSIGAGALAAAVCVGFQYWLVDLDVARATVRLYIAPFTEEIAKAAFVAIWIGRRRVGFLVDAAVVGFAVGTGFALVENAEYLRSLGSPSLWLWAVRGFGTALLHGAATSIFSMIAKSRAERRPDAPGSVFVPAIAAAVALHAGFNGLPLPPVAKMLALLTLLPACVLFVFHRSERATREWVGSGLDLDLELLQLVLSEHFSATRLGTYLTQLRTHFHGPVVADMFSLLRLELELSVRAKAMLMARQAGLHVPVDVELQDTLDEIAYLRRSIGPTGLLALKPLEVTSDKDHWHRHLLEEALRAANKHR
jgi:RsiW-degrading membrane proteinase PrsW (M82 family)